MPDRDQGGVRPPAASTPGCPWSRRPASCTRSGCRSWPTPRTWSTCSSPTSATRRATCRCWCPTSAASTGPWRRGCGTSRSSAAPPRPSPSATSTAASTSSSRCSSRPYDGRATPAWTCGPTCRCASATRGRARSRSQQVVDVGTRLFDLGASQLSLGDTIGVGTAAHVTALLGAFNDAGLPNDVAGHALPRHLRPGAVQRRRRAALRDHHVRRVGRRPRRLPLRQERDRQPRHRGPGLAAHRPRHRARRRPRRAGRDVGLDGRRAGPAESVRRRPGVGRVARRGRADFRP